MNERRLREAGILVPQTGRSDPYFAAHHRVAWELLGNWRTKRDRASLVSELAREIVASRAPVACVSSEDFQKSFNDPAALEHFRDVFEAAGIELKIVLYFRPHAEYFEAIYADAVRSGAVFRFQWLMLDVFQTGLYCPGSPAALSFEYASLVDCFANIFGIERIVARRYVTGGDIVRFARGFLKLVTAGSNRIALEDFVLPSVHNRSLQFGELLAKLSANRVAHGLGPIPLDMRPTFDHACDLIGLREATQFVRRFLADSRRLFRRTGIVVPPIGGRALLADVRAELGLEPAIIERRRALQAAEIYLSFLPPKPA